MCKLTRFIMFCLRLENSYHAPDNNVHEYFVGKSQRDEGFRTPFEETLSKYRLTDRHNYWQVFLS